MNKEELLLEIDKEIEKRESASPLSYRDGVKDGLRLARVWAEQLEEPTAKEPIVVPASFDEWYQAIKGKYTFVYAHKAKAIENINKIGFGHGLENAHGRNLSDHSDKWGALRNDIASNKEEYTRAILDGYEVEEEKRWKLRFTLPDILSKSPDYSYLNWGFHTKTYFLSDDIEIPGSQAVFTDSDLEEIEEEYDLSGFIKEEVVDE